MEPRSHRIASLFVLPLLAAGCGQDMDPADQAGPDAGQAAAVTWHQDIAPLVAEHCSSCHVAGGIGPFDITSYENAAGLAPLIASAVEDGVMPPWSAVAGDDCQPRFGWKDDPRLSDDEIALLRAWADAGAPEGDPETAAPIPEIESARLEGVTHELSPAQGYATSGEADELICFVLDPELDAPAWLTGIDFRPGDLSVVHHAVLTAVPAAQADAVRAQVGPDGSFDCFGGVTVPGSYFLGVWVPGSLPFEAPPDVGVPLAAGTITVLQIHYHPAGAEHEPEKTTVELRVTDEQPEKFLIFGAVGNAFTEPLLLPGPGDEAGVEFRIPAGAADHTETMRFPISLDTAERFPLLSVFPHMHYVGVDLEATISRSRPAPGEPDEECLINNQWNFDWQRTYQFDAPIDELPTVGDGDQITLRCEYDNTMENPFVARGLEEMGLENPIDVTLGEETLDEMCLMAFGIVLDAP